MRTISDLSTGRCLKLKDFLWARQWSEKSAFRVAIRAEFERETKNLVSKLFAASVSFENGIQFPLGDMRVRDSQGSSGGPAAAVAAAAA